jgi:hypothetical protein
LDYAVKPQAAEMVSHPALRQVSRLLAKERCQILAQVAIRETAWEQLKQQQGAP